MAILLTTTLHELSHGLTAYRLGDPTARTAGRLTLNPLAHLDLVGTVMFLVVGFGWAKPVPVNPFYFRRPSRDMALVSAAGPGANFAAAIIFGLLLRLLDRLAPGFDTPSVAVSLKLLFAMIAYISLALGLFNLIPIPPLDGSHILEEVLPERWRPAYQSIAPLGPMLMVLVFVLPTFFNVSIVGYTLGPIRDYMFTLITGAPATM